jgi:hypothetical protein
MPVAEPEPEPTPLLSVLIESVMVEVPPAVSIEEFSIIDVSESELF